MLISFSKEEELEGSFILNKRKVPKGKKKLKNINFLFKTNNIWKETSHESLFSIRKSKIIVFENIVNKQFPITCNIINMHKKK